MWQFLGELVMDKAVALVIKGFMELNSAQRSEFVSEINSIINDKAKEQPLRESVRKSVYGSTVNFGPASTGCPCCGK
jgi:hypothetical protein